MTTAGRAGPSLATRLFVAQALTAVVGAATLWLVASAAGPGIFHQHLRQAAGHVVSSETSRHVEEAYTSASAVSIAVALLASLAAALAVSAYVSRRIAGPVGRVAAAARDVSAGRYDTEVPDAGLGAEFATLTASFNAMAERLAAVETTRRRLLADLAHEMRTPVSTLEAVLEGLEDGVVTLGPDTLATLRAQSARLARLAEDVASVSRAEEHQLHLHRQPVDPAQLAAAVTESYRDRFAAKGVSLRAVPGPSVPAIDVDPDRLGQVLGNLLDNALRHTPRGGAVTVASRAADAGGTVELAVTDTGEGIPPQHLPHVFERFYRVDSARDRAHGGSGIGLAIVKALVEAHGGTVAVTSEGAGRGSTFVVRLPPA